MAVKRLLDVARSVAGIAAGLLLLAAAPGQASNLLRDGTFQNPIGTGSNLTPWSDWINAGITTTPAPFAIGGNAARIPVRGDLFQRFDPLLNGRYELSFFVQNESNWDAKLVFSFQKMLGIPVSITFPMGLGKEISLQANSLWTLIEFDFEISDPFFPVNELYFSNSYNSPEPIISDSINPPGTIISVANVYLRSVTDGVPEPESWMLLIVGFGVVGLSLRRERVQGAPDRMLWNGPSRLSVVR